MNTPTSSPPRIVSRSDWLVARTALLAREKDLAHQRDALSAERRQLPWVKIDKPYVFEGPDGREPLAALFGERSQLIVYHFMFGPGWEEGCPSCSFLLDHIDGILPHLGARDTAFAAVSRASWPEIEAFQRRMGWKSQWVSDAGSGFNADFHTSFTREDMEAGRVTYNYQTFPPGLLPVEELPGLSVFARDATGAVFHTYSSYARGCDPLLGTYQWLDLTPKGRDEDGLASTMAWVRHHDRYDHTYKLDPTATYQPPRGSLFRPCCSGDHAS
ncbi:MAG: DUF899 domain-containing protein [Opitutae bacterium]|nr:DUF899 domain-containing protein [Opitutae bacterium]